MHELLSVIYSIAGDVFVFQQDNVPTPTHRGHDLVELLCHETHRSLIVIMSPTDITDLIPVRVTLLV